MKTFSKGMIGAALAAMVTVTAAAPAEARPYYRHHDNGIDAGDVIAGVAIIGGIAAIASAIGSSNRDRYDDRYDRSSYGYGYGNRGYGEGAAVSACSAEAARFGRGQVRITDVDRRGNDSFRVRGIIDGNGGGYYGGGYGYDRIGFDCDAYGNGRIADFDTDRYR